MDQIVKKNQRRLQLLKFHLNVFCVIAFFIYWIFYYNFQFEKKNNTFLMGKAMATKTTADRATIERMIL